ncbi:MAG: metallophosphoesterase [Oscillospiraceae bacterium]|nr:metallophosphoesterase [Oscillospiraceae bacterium]
MKNTIPKKRTRVLFLALLALIGILMTLFVTPFAVNADTSSTNRLWITEIYTNDISREAVYGSTANRMEFVEIYNSGTASLNFGTNYKLTYYATNSGSTTNPKDLVVAVTATGDNLNIAGGEVVVIWFNRTDVTNATLTEFRKAMDIPASVRVWKGTGQNGLANGTNDDGRGIAIRNSGGTIISYFHYNKTNDADLSSGRSVDLRVPDSGTTMVVSRANQPPSPGYVYNEQLNGQYFINKSTPPAPGLYVTEIYSTDIDRRKNFGGAGALMDWLEVTNTTDSPITLNQDYHLVYFNHLDYRNGGSLVNQTASTGGDVYEKYLPVTQANRTTTTGCVVPAHGSAVIWCDRTNYLSSDTSYTSLPDIAFFRRTFDIPASVPIYTSATQNGWGANGRGFQIRTGANGGTNNKLFSYFYWNGIGDLARGKSVELQVSPEGPRMQVYNNLKSAMYSGGTYQPDQVTYPGPVKVNLNGGAAVNGQEVSGVVTVTAKDYAKTSSLTFAVDGVAQQGAHPAVEGSAYYFEYPDTAGNGIDGYYKNAIVNGKTVLDIFTCNNVNYGQYGSASVKVDSALFTYNTNGTATIRLDMYAGTRLSIFDSWNTHGSDDDSNNDDFSVYKTRLSLPDGTQITPSSYTGKNVTKGSSGTMETLNPTDTQIKMGDSTNCYVYTYANFTVPAAKVDHRGLTIDTTKLSDGMHTLTVSGGASAARSITFMVKNHEQGVTKLSVDTQLPLSVDSNAAKAGVPASSASGAETVSVYKAEELSFDVLEGNGDSTASAVAKSGLGVTTASNGEFPYQIFELETEGKSTEEIRFEVSAVGNYGRDAQLYALNTVSNVWELLEVTRNGNVITAVFSLGNRLYEGKVKVLVQARGTEAAPQTAPQTGRTTAGSYNWNGNAEPTRYDFSFAWITDTQYYAEKYTSPYTSMMNWIVDNKDAKRIRYVLHTGDIVDDFNQEYQWKESSNQLKKLETAGLPYGVLAGNHDVGHGAELYAYYNQYFPASRFRNNPWYGGEYKNNLGHYDLVTVDGVELVMLYLSWDMHLDDAVESQIAWANKILTQYADRKAIVLMHPGINSSASADLWSNLMAEKVYPYHTNVIAELNGHYHGSAINVITVGGRAIPRICTDYQSLPNGGDGYIKMMYFDLSNGKIYMNGYSPYVNDTNYFSKSKLSSYGSGTAVGELDIFELSVDFGRTVTRTLNVTDAKAALLTETEVGTAHAASTGNTEVALTLEKGVSGLLYAKVFNGDDQAIAVSAPVPYATEAPIPQESDIIKYLLKQTEDSTGLDVNDDKTVDILDLLEARQYWRSVPGE